MAGCTPSLCSRTFTVGQYRHCPCIFRRGETTDDRPVERVVVSSENCVYGDVYSKCNDEKLQRRFYDDCCSIEKNSFRDPQFTDKEHSIAFS